MTPLCRAAGISILPARDGNFIILDILLRPDHTETCGILKIVRVLFCFEDTLVSVHKDLNSTPSTEKKKTLLQIRVFAASVGHIYSRKTREIC